MICVLFINVLCFFLPFRLNLQVACKVFDMIGRMVVHHNRHNYETLIKALCHCGQYIRWCIIPVIKCGFLSATLSPHKNQGCQFHQLAVN